MALGKHANYFLLFGTVNFPSAFDYLPSFFYIVCLEFFLSYRLRTKYFSVSRKAITIR